MEYNEIIDARFSALEARFSAIEHRMAVIERAVLGTSKRKKRELTPEERVAVRARLLAGQEKARLKREAGAKKEK
ncbi:hypothetical protein ACFLYB_03645 [Chloroflexota bacterium]